MMKHLKKKNYKICCKTINHWCTEVNIILHGKRSAQQKDHDQIKNSAHQWYLKHKKKIINCVSCDIPFV